MSLKQYKESLGLIGTDSLSFMADRMFSVMDTNSDGYVSLTQVNLFLFAYERVTKQWLALVKEDSERWKLCHQFL